MKKKSIPKKFTAVSIPTTLFRKVEDRIEGRAWFLSVANMGELYVVGYWLFYQKL